MAIATLASPTIFKLIEKILYSNYIKVNQNNIKSYRYKIYKSIFML